MLKQKAKVHYISPKVSIYTYFCLLRPFSQSGAFAASNKAANLLHQGAILSSNKMTWNMSHSPKVASQNTLYFIRDRSLWVQLIIETNVKIYYNFIRFFLKNSSESSDMHKNGHACNIKFSIWFS